jgi:hypothetical protein
VRWRGHEAVQQEAELVRSFEDFVRNVRQGIPQESLNFTIAPGLDPGQFASVSTALRVFMIHLPITYPSVPVTIPPKTSAT